MYTYRLKLFIENDNRKCGQYNQVGKAQSVFFSLYILFFSVSLLALSCVCDSFPLPLSLSASETTTKYKYEKRKKTNLFCYRCLMVLLH